MNQVKWLWSAVAFLGLQATSMGQENLETITLGAGCFWCVEAVYESIPGVELGVSGYSGGHIKNPGYREVCTGRTGHAEVVQVTFDNTRLSLAELLEMFFATHDPTTLNRQGADVGTQYRSAIYFHNEGQREIAKAAKLKAQDDWDSPSLQKSRHLKPSTKLKITTKRIMSSTKKRHIVKL